MGAISRTRAPGGSARGLCGNAQAMWRDRQSVSGEMLGNEHPAVAREFLDQAQLLLVEKFLRKAADDGQDACSRHSEKNAA